MNETEPAPGAEEFAARLHAAAARAVPPPDAAEQAALRATRAAAVAQRRRRAPWPAWAAPAAVFACAAVVLAGVVLVPLRPGAPPSSALPDVALLDALAASEDPDFLRELEFLEWLDATHPG